MSHGFSLRLKEAATVHVRENYVATVNAGVCSSKVQAIKYDARTSNASTVCVWHCSLREKLTRLVLSKRHWYIVPRRLAVASTVTSDHRTVSPFSKQ
jgi:hypothetical protein